MRLVADGGNSADGMKGPKEVGRVGTRRQCEQISQWTRVAYYSRSCPCGFTVCLSVCVCGVVCVVWFWLGLSVAKSLFWLVHVHVPPIHRLSP